MIIGSPISPDGALKITPSRITFAEAVLVTKVITVVLNFICEKERASRRPKLLIRLIN